MSRDSYTKIESLWERHPIDPITQVEAGKIARRLFRIFGQVKDGSPAMRGPSRVRPTRRCWASTERTAHYGRSGVRRLIHDVSHYIFRDRHPNARPHDGGHSQLEYEMACYVLAHGLNVKAPAAAKPGRAATLAAERDRAAAAMKRWQTKAKRAETALRKLRAKSKRIERALADLVYRVDDAPEGPRGDDGNIDTRDAHAALGHFEQITTDPPGSIQP